MMAKLTSEIVGETSAPFLSRKFKILVQVTGTGKGPGALFWTDRLLGQSAKLLVLVPVQIAVAVFVQTDELPGKHALHVFVTCITFTSCKMYT